jgi:Mrp family chromosome partitioning ATPase
MIAENRVRLNAKALSDPKVFQLDENPKGIPGTAGGEPVLAGKNKVQQRSRQDGSLSIPWLNSIKSAAKGWEWKERIRSNHSGADLEAITREEEIKLVQRVFPGVALDSPKVALIAGLEGGIGCARTCARAAELLAARAEGPVCVVDANFQMPSLHEYFGAENLKGLAEATVESGPIQNFAQQIPEPDLWLIPTGKAAAQLRFPAMADGLRVRIEELRETFKYVVIHSGPLRMETSAALLSRWTDGVVLVVEANATRRDAARRVKEMLDAANVNLLGVVLNNRTFPIPDAIYRRLY